MTPWQWWAGEAGENTYDLAFGEPTKDAAIRKAMRQMEPGEEFQVVEARSSTAAKYDGADIVPFMRTRNYQRLVVGPQAFSLSVPVRGEG